jgi:hypothetical protein
MEKEKLHQPTEEEIKKAEEMMTNDQKEASEGREKKEKERIHSMAKELKDKLSEEAEERYSPPGSKYANWGSAGRPRILDTAKGKIIAIPVYENRDHGVDASVTEIHFFDTDGNPIKTVKSKYKRTATNFCEIYPTFEKEEQRGKEIIKIEYIQSKHIGFDTHSGHQYKRTVVGKEEIEF